MRLDGGTALPQVRMVIHGAAAVADHALRVHQPSALVRPVLVNGAAGGVAILAGQPVAVLGFTVSHGKITEIYAIADPERLRRFDLADLDG